MLRGARQVGKSFLVRQFAESQFDGIIEINFERNPEHASLFSTSPTDTIRKLELLSGQKIEPGKTLVFLDEIQAAAPVFPTLRYFYEELPEQHVIAAGSLLEFVLEEHEFPMPVGRIEYFAPGTDAVRGVPARCRQRPMGSLLRRVLASGSTSRKRSIPNC